MTEGALPIHVDTETEYYRIRYNFCPQSISNSTVARTLNRDEKDPSIGWMNHTLDNGKSCKFKGEWCDSSNNYKECIFVICDDEVKLLPLSSSIMGLRKAND